MRRRQWVGPRQVEVVLIRHQAPAKGRGARQPVDKRAGKWQAEAVRYHMLVFVALGAVAHLLIEIVAVVVVVVAERDGTQRATHKYQYLLLLVRAGSR